MAVEKVKYICVSPAFLGEEQVQKQRMQEELSGLIMRLRWAMEDNLGWLRLERTEQGQKQVFYYNRNIRGLFPDLSRSDYTPSARINSPGTISRLLSAGLFLEDMPASLLEKSELRAAFPMRRSLKWVAAQWQWPSELLSGYIAVLPVEYGSEVCRADGEGTVSWGANTEERAYLIPVVHLANYVSGNIWQNDLLFLMRKYHLLPVGGGGEQDEAFLARYGEFLKSVDDTLSLDMEQLDRAVDAVGNQEKVVKPADKEQSGRLRAELLKCDYFRAGLVSYDDSILTPLNGHWDLWPYVQFNDVPEEQLPPPPPGKIWVNVSGENIYARNAADDLAPAAETVSVDFGTKSTTVARMDDEGNIVTLRIGEDGTKTIDAKTVSAKSMSEKTGAKKTGAESGSEQGYENPTILKYIDLDSFQAAYGSAAGRPETSISDLSASHAAERQFKDRSREAIDGILAYQYQIKQWAFDNQFAPLLFDSHRQITLKPYREIGEEDFDPIEAYAYLVGLTVVNMRRQRICTRYVLSYPPSYGVDICEKMRQSFERGIRKAIPVEAQQMAAFQNGFSVLLRQSEPAAYAVCALKEFGIEHDQALCGVYDLGGGTVDYHFGIFSGDRTPFWYESLRSGGNPRLGCENIIETAAYAVFSLVKEELRECKIPYEFPKQYSSNLEDMRYTSHSQLARFNTLGMVDALRQLWIQELKPADRMSDQLCHFWVHSELEEQLYLEIEAKPAAKGEEPPAKWERDEKQLKILLDPQFLRDFFHDKLSATIWEFLEMHKAVRAETGGDLPQVIFLAGNGSRAPLIKEIFQKYLPQFGVENCQLYPPLGTREAAEMEQWTQDRPGSIPNAKTGVAHGLLIALPGSDFIQVVEKHRAFMFRFHVGVSRYDRKVRGSVFQRKRSAESFELFERYAMPADESADTPFLIAEDGYLQFWYTDAALSLESTPVADCGARQFLIRVPDTLLSQEHCDGVRGVCYYQAVSEKELELFIQPCGQTDCVSYGILNLDSGHFEQTGQIL